jgi:hypothetical protein
MSISSRTYFLTAQGLSVKKYPTREPTSVPNIFFKIISENYFYQS